MKPAPFTYHRPASIDEALDLIARLGDEAKFLAGGQSLVAMMNFRLARPSALVDISRLDELAYLRHEGGGLCIGALTRHRAVEMTTDAGVLRDFGVLPRAARFVGHYPIRHAGTFGGSIAHADPAAEWCLLATALDAEMVARSIRGERTIPVRDFFLSFLTTALGPDELLVEVRFPRPAPHAALTEFSRRRGDFAIVAAAVAFDLDPNGICTDTRIALGGVGVTPVRIVDAERVLHGTRLEPEAIAEAAAVAAKSIDPPSDLHGTSAYRRHLANTLIQRACAEALTHDA